VNGKLKDTYVLTTRFSSIESPLAEGAIVDAFVTCQAIVARLRADGSVYKQVAVAALRPAQLDTSS